MTGKTVATEPRQFGERAIRMADCTGGPWWVLSDLCAVLGISSNHIYRVHRKLSEEDKTRVHILVGKTDTRAVIVRTEAACTFLETSSRPHAKELREWLLQQTGSVSEEPAAEAQAAVEPDAIQETEAAPEPSAPALPAVVKPFDRDIDERALQTASFDFGGREVRAVQVEGEPWLVLSDVCDALGLQNSRMTAKRLGSGEVAVRNVYTGFGPRPTMLINEAGLYGVVLQSRKPQARAFQQWVKTDVLPSVMRTGVYAAPRADVAAGLSDEALDRLLADPRFLARALARLQALQEENRSLQLEAESYRPVEAPEPPQQEPVGEELLTITEIAKSLGTTGTELNQVLHELGVQYKSGSAWFLYTMYDRCGYTKTVMYEHETERGARVRPHTRWTAKGYHFILDLLRSKGMLDAEGRLQQKPPEEEKAQLAFKV